MKNTMPAELAKKLWSGTYDASTVAEARTLYTKEMLSGGVFSSVLYTYAKHLKAESDDEKYKNVLAEAVSVSDSFVEVGIDALTSDDLDVRQSILRAAGRFDDALRTIEAGLSKGDVQKHTQALLLVGKVDVLQAMGKSASDMVPLVTELTSLIDGVAKEYPEQAIRLYRALVRHYKTVGNAEKVEMARKNAETLIKETGAEDQRLKLQFDLQL